jgi:hypothetical protein
MSSLSAIELPGATAGALNLALFGAAVPRSGKAEGTLIASGDPVKPPQADQVEVSRAAEARLLRSQGVSLGEIEATLGVGEATVTSYLGITDGIQTLQEAATAAVESSAA